MKTLNTINKTFNVFRIITKVLMILSFVAAVIELVGGILLIAVMNSTYSIDLSMFMEISEGADLKYLSTKMFIDVICSATEGILLLFATRYFTSELADGTPFTSDGAKQVRTLGILTIVLPNAAELISLAVHYFTGYGDNNVNYNGYLILGIVLILISLILQHGAEIQSENREETEI